MYKIDCEEEYSWQLTEMKMWLGMLATGCKIFPWLDNFLSPGTSHYFYHIPKDMFSILKYIQK